MKKNWFDYLWIFRPAYWLMNEDFSKRWDKKFLELLKAHRFENADHYKAHLGDYTIWIANYPYGTFEPWQMGLPTNMRPSRSTISFARRRLLADLLIDDDPFPRDEVEELRAMYAAPERGDSK
jgi:hypothetical protein